MVINRSAALGLAIAGLLALSGLALAPAAWSQAQETEVDTALIVSVDVSNSVDDYRYKLQMEGIAQALEDKSVVDAIIGGAKGGILFSLVTWADKPRVAIPWKRITSVADAKMLALEVRTLPQQGGEFTCVTGMLRNVADKLITQIPMKATRIVLDVSGDGKENCNPLEPTTAVRDELVSYNVTINGLPILEGDQSETLEEWYRANVMGGPGSFVLPAEGFEDFGRAIRQKFVIEISALRERHPATVSRNWAPPDSE